MTSVSCSVRVLLAASMILAFLSIGESLPSVFFDDIRNLYKESGNNDVGGGQVNLEWLKRSPVPSWRGLRRMMMMGYNGNPDFMVRLAQNH